MQSLTGPVLLSHPSLSEPSVKLLALDTMNVDLILRVENNDIFISTWRPVAGKSWEWLVFL